MPSLGIPRALIAIAAAATLAACQDQAPIVLVRDDAPTLTGTSIFLQSSSPTCSRTEKPTARAADGGPPPAWLTMTAESRCPGYFIGNPGSEGLPGMPSVPPPDPGTDTSTGQWVTLPCDDYGHYLVVNVSPDAPLGRQVVGVRLAGCGSEFVAPLALDIRGRADLRGFCGLHEGDFCAADADCIPSGSLCTMRAAAFTSTSSPGCADPAVHGAACGCVRGLCAWSIPW